MLKPPYPAPKCAPPSRRSSPHRRPTQRSAGCGRPSSGWRRPSRSCSAASGAHRGTSSPRAITPTSRASRMPSATCARASCSPTEFASASGFSSAPSSSLASSPIRLSLISRFLRYCLLSHCFRSWSVSLVYTPDFVDEWCGWWQWYWQLNLIIFI